MEYQNENFNGVYDFRSRFHDGWTVAEHLHEYSEFLYCTEGEGYAAVNGRTVPLRKGEFVWIPPNYTHRYACENACVICAVFSNDLIPLFFHVARGRYFCPSAVLAGELANILESFPHLQKEDILTVSGYLNLLCAKVAREEAFASEAHTNGILYQKVITYLSKHYAEDVSLSEIAKRFGYNEKYLSHALHSLTGIHFRQLLAFYRISRARQLLEHEREKSITAIAAECGFSAQNSFHRAFKSITGMTPSAYRRQFLQG